MILPTGLVNLDHQLRSEGLNNSIVEIYFISGRTSTNNFACEHPYVSCNLKTIPSAAGTTSKWLKLSAHPYLLSMIATSGNYSATTLTAKIGRNTKMIADNFTDHDH